MTVRRIQSIDSLYDFIGYVVLCAPDQFPKRDYLTSDQQMSLDRAFDELRHAISLVEADFPGADQQRGLSVILDRSLASYRQGDIVAGAHTLQDFQDLIFKV
ncbi:hypothetical protein FHY30_002069 [Xanthomonas arboricola]|uniref:hypothetical protein n=1 Tax=Xanthomonas campestris TaxID=339 RepID=UPI0023E93465|nr:hypothetical protein [Xanthomonas campestris]